MENLGTALTSLMLRFAGVLAIIVTCWQALVVLWHGGNPRALKEGFVRVIIIYIALALLANPAATGELFGLIAGALFNAGAEAIREAL